jgi:hypothetical protein
MAKQRSVAGTKDDPTIQFADLTINGQSFRLCYSFNAIAIAESAAGCNLLRGLESLTDLSATQLRGLLYAALLVAQPEMTVEDAGRLIRLDTINPITAALAEAYSLSLPEQKKSNDEANANS